MRSSPRTGVASLAELPAGARIATSSVRRRAFVRHARADLELFDLRGNVPTRVRYLDEGRFEAIIVAAAGLNRLGMSGRIGAYLDPAGFPPAAAQGALGVCARADDAPVLNALAALDHPHSRIAVFAERAFLRQLEAGCQVPAGVLATVRGGRLHLYGVKCEPDGTGWASASLDAALHEGEAAGRQLAIDLAVGVLLSKRHSSPLARARVLVTRAEGRNGPLSSLLRARGAIVVHWPRVSHRTRVRARAYGRPRASRAL